MILSLPCPHSPPIYNVFHRFPRKINFILDDFFICESVISTYSTFLLIRRFNADTDFRLVVSTSLLQLRGFHMTINHVFFTGVVGLTSYAANNDNIIGLSEVGLLDLFR